MDERKIRQIVQDEMRKEYRAGSPEIPPHRHNGTDNLKINQADIVPSVKGTALIISLQSETFTVTVTSSPKSVFFYGFAANNAGGGTATQRAIVNGNAQLGKSYSFTNNTASALVPGATQNLIQVSNSMFVDTAAIGNNRVRASNDSLVNVGDSGGTTVARAVITAFDDKSITIQTTLSAGWQISGNILVI